MKKLKYIAIVLCLVMLMGNVTAFAAGITAELSKNNIYVGGQPVQMTAYLINGNNYVRLRDIGKAVDFSVFYDASTNSVRLNSRYPYVPEENEQPPVASASATAALSSQKIYVNSKLVEMTAYSINGNNYVKLRDIGQAIDFSVTYDGNTNSVLIDKSLPYGAETTFTPPTTPEPTPESGKTPITEKVLDGAEHSREDFSQAANPAAFSGIYTKGAYNALRQSIVDRDIIIADNNEDGFNPYYSYANFVDKSFVVGESNAGTTHTFMSNAPIGRLGGYYVYAFGVEPYIKGYSSYPGYGIIKVFQNTGLAAANAATDSLITEVGALSSDREKVIKLSDYICDRMAYGESAFGNGLNEVFTSTTPIKGLCGTYANAFLYLCQRANIPCITYSDNDHAWNVVYVEGKWLVVDVTNYDTERSMRWILTDSYPKQDKKPDETIFFREVLVPGSTK